LESKIRVGAVSYLNTKPLVSGFENGQMSDEMELQFDYPSRIASMLLNDEIDLGLVPVAVIPKLKEYHIISDCCIGASGPVASVCLFSEVPLSEIENVLVDYQSRTSAALLRILLDKHWKITPTLLDARVGYRKDINGTTAGLVIGDRALQQRRCSKYVYDLAVAWQEMTGLPFVFAAWVANKKLPDHFVSDFSKLTAAGLNNLETIAGQNSIPGYDIYHYYTQNIDYKLNDQKLKALHLFLSYLPQV
jgi:chorismate dehydratase